MATKENIEAAKKLVKRYREISLDEIKINWTIDGKITAEKLTGFGNIYECKLCMSAKSDCSKCIHGYKEFIKKGCIEITYDNISFSETPEELKSAFEARANHIEQILKNLEK